MNSFEFQQAAYANGWRDQIATNGKLPCGAGWQKMRGLTPEQLQAFGATGGGHLAADTPGLDIDVMHPEAAAACEEVVRTLFDGSAILVRFGLPPKRLIPFRRTGDPFKKILVNLIGPNGDTHRLEFLGDGQQYVMHGRHPDTKAPYTWASDLSPATVGRDEIPTIDGPNAEALVDALVAMLESDFEFKVANNPAPNGHTRAGPVDGDIHPGNINNAQRVATHDRLRTGDNVDDITHELVEATQKVGRADWNWEKEERQIRWMCYRLINKDSTLAHTLPEKLWQAWQAVVAGGGIPKINARGRGFRVEDTAKGVSPKVATDGPSIPRGWILSNLNNITPPEWRIKGVLPKEAVLVLAGQWGTHKTNVLLALSSALMTGAAFAGHYKVAEKCAVMMYALEGAAGIDRRLLAVSGYEIGSAPQLPFFRNDTCSPLSHPHTAAQIIADINQASAYAEQHFGLRVGVLWIDHYSLAVGHTGSGDDNDTTATQKAYNTLRTISRECKIVCAVVDHYGKLVEAGTAGSSKKEGNADTVLANLASRDNAGTLDDTRVVIRKQRDGEAGIEIPFETEVVTVCYDDDGDPVTAVKLVWGEARATRKRPKPGANDKLLVRALDETLREQGFAFHPDFETETTACLEAAVKDRFYELFPRGEGTDQQYQQRRAMALDRAMRKAMGEGQLERSEWVDGDVLYPTSHCSPT
jgi:AAA domain